MTKLQKTDTQLATATPIPAYLQRAEGQAARGTEGMEAGKDYTLPRVALCQSNTPQRKKGELSHIPGLEEGLFFNTITGEIYGTKLRVVPVFFFRQRMYFRPMTEGGGMLCQSLNGVDGGQLHPSDCATCPHAQFKTAEQAVKGDTRPDCNLMLCYTVIAPGGNVAVLSLKSTSLKTAKQFNAQVRLSNLDMFAKFLDLEVVSATRQNNQFWMPVLKWSDFVPEAIHQAGIRYFEELRGKGIQVDTTGLETEGDGEERTVVADKDIPF